MKKALTEQRSLNFQDFHQLMDLLEIPLPLQAYFIQITLRFALENINAKDDFE